MIKYIRYLFWGAIALVLIVVSLANRGSVTLNTLPSGLGGMPGGDMVAFSVDVPLFIVILVSIGVGVAIGYIWEWIREWKLRSAASRGQREARELKREVKRLKGEKHEGKDEVLALLDDA
ncbi:MAG: LapA family protein [Pseudomonadota bacterium]